MSRMGQMMDNRFASSEQMMEARLASLGTGGNTTTVPTKSPGTGGMHDYGPH